MEWASLALMTIGAVLFAWFGILVVWLLLVRPKGDWTYWKR